MRIQSVPYLITYVARQMRMCQHQVRIFVNKRIGYLPANNFRVEMSLYNTARWG